MQWSKLYQIEDPTIYTTLLNFIYTKAGTKQSVEHDQFSLSKLKELSIYAEKVNKLERSSAVSKAIQEYVNYQEESSKNLGKIGEHASSLLFLEESNRKIKETLTRQKDFTLENVNQLKLKS